MIKNTTTLSKELFEFIAKLNTKAPVVVVVRAVFLAVACVFAWIAYNNFGSGQGNCFSVLCLVCVVISVWAVPTMLKSKTMKNAPASGTRTYEFGPDQMTVVVPVADGEAWSKMPYDAIAAVFETESALYLQIKKNSAYMIVSKDGFTQGSAAQLVELLKEKGINK